MCSVWQYFLCISCALTFLNNVHHIYSSGFGLHAGKAVQGAIGSQRKLDATYISESVERSEFLESATKTYGVPLLMTDSVYNLLDPSNRYRCRKIDQLIMLSEEESGLTDPHEILDSGEKVNLVSICFLHMYLFACLNVFSHALHSLIRHTS